MSDAELLTLLSEEERSEFKAMAAHPGVKVARFAFATLSRISPGAAAVVIEQLASRPKSFAAPEREREVLATGRRHTIRTTVCDIAAWEWGTGPTVHLVHGWQGRGGQLCAMVEPLVAAGFRVLMWDGPAHGQSGLKRASAPEFATVIRDITREEGQPYAVIAHSMGTIASTLASWEGYAPQRRVYIGTAHAPEKPLRMLEQVMGFSPEAIDRYAQRVVARSPIAMDWSYVREGGVPAEMHDALLMIHDRGDREAALDSVAKLQRLRPDAEVMLTNGLGHNRILRDPAVVKAAVDFLTRDRV